MMRFATVVKFAAIVIGLVVAAAVGFLLTFDANRYKGLVVQAVYDATGRTLVIAGDFKLNLGLKPSVSVKGVRFANAIWGTQRDMVQVEELSAEVALVPLFNGDVRIRRVVLRGTDILMETDGKGHANWVFEPTKTKSGTEPPATQDGEATAIPTFDLVAIENARLTWRDGLGGEPVVFVIGRLEGRAAGPDTPVSLNAEGSYNGNGFALDGVFGALSRLAKGGAWPVDVTIRTGGAKITAKGGVAKPMLGEGVEFELTAAGEDLSALSGLAGFRLPAMGRYRFKGTLAQAPEAWQVSGMEIGIGGSRISGQVEFRPGQVRPAFNIDLHSEMIDVAEFSDKDSDAGEGEDVSGAGEAGDGRLFSAEPLAVEALKAVDAAVTVRIGRLKSGAFEFSGVKANAGLRDGLLRLRSFHLGLAGGEVAAQAELSAAGEAVETNLRVKLTRIDIDDMLRRFDVTDVAKGTFDADIQVSGRGSSVRDLMAGLDGTTSVVMGKGVLDSRYVNLVGADVLRSIAPWLTDEKKGTAVNCAVSRFLVKDGIATSSGFLFDTDLVTIGGRGQVDLRTEKLDLTLLPKPKDASLLSLAAPVNVRGTLASPTAAPDTAEVAKKVAVGLVGGLINPLGILVPLVSGGSGDKNPCVVALAGRGGETSPRRAPESESPVDKIGETIKDVGESIGKGLKSLFGQ